MTRLCLILASLLTLASLAPAQRQPGRNGARAPVNRPKWNIAAQLPPALKTALKAVGQIRYSGTRVIEAKNGPNRERHTEFVITAGVHSRIEFPADSPMHGQVIVESPQGRRHYNPANNELQVLPAQRDQAYERLAKMVANRNVVVTQTAGGNIAGQATELISIGDRQGNILQKLWIEPKTGMILKRELFDRGGALQASFEFTQVNLNPIIDRTEFRLEPSGVTVVTPDTVLNRLMRRGGFVNVRIPPGTGYRLEAARVQRMADQPVLVQHYTGNGHRITLYQLKTSVNRDRLKALERPDVQIHAWEAKGSSFVLVGDLSDAELRDLGHRLGG
jgi:outer membrane lipoprotein-sorting protein